ncbi:DUF6518 family protein [Nocardiopsis sp. FR6]|uniref:DUF6518 family protein n=1 Tax=Nocardiopsis sp. FR6 TaxID=2605986 RepID=UPI0013593C80|nr:DUF6518 family protein [Nocardiopsis sp. FR6]
MRSANPGHLLSLTAWLWQPQEGPNTPVSRPRAFLNEHMGLFFLLAVVVGGAAGLLSGTFVLKWDEWNSPSFGPFIAPAVLLGWLTARPRWAAVIGLTTLVASVAGHFLGTQLAGHEQNVLEYRAWAVVGLCLGPLLGYLGHTLRSRRLLARAACAGLVSAWLCVPLYLGFVTGSEYYVEYSGVVTRSFDLSMAVLVLVLCRGFSARLMALVCAALFLWPLTVVSVLNSVFLWRASGGL